MDKQLIEAMKEQASQEFARIVEEAGNLGILMANKVLPDGGVEFGLNSLEEDYQKLLKTMEDLKTLEKK